MGLSIIIPAHNEARMIVRCIKSLLPQLSKGDEVIVVDNASTDETRALMGTLAKQPVFRYVTESSLGPSFARNRGFQISKSKWIAFIDADCIASRHWVQTAKKVLASDSADNTVFVGDIIHRFPSNGVLEMLFHIRHAIDWSAIRRSKAWREHRRIDYIHGGNLFGRKSVFAMMKPLFDADAFPYVGEERDLAYRFHKKGVAIRFERSARVIHYKKRIRFISSLRSAAILGITQAKLEHHHLADRSVRSMFPQKSSKRGLAHRHSAINRHFSGTPLLLVYAHFTDMLRQLVFSASLKLARLRFGRT